MTPPSRHRAFLFFLLMTALLALVAAGWPHPVVSYGTRAATSPIRPTPAQPTPPPSAPAQPAPAQSPAAQSAPARPVPLAGTVSVNPLSPTGAALGSAGPAWHAPLDGPLTLGRGFSPPSSPYGPGHRGIDLVAAPGAQVRAAGRGIVSFAGMIAGRGVTTISHGSLRTTYEPVDPAVTTGQTVAAGETIGRLVAGHPGCPADACLHWGLREGARYLDPLGLLRRRPPRLLPIG